jgi:hypothetical protein
LRWAAFCATKHQENKRFKARAEADISGGARRTIRKGTSMDKCRKGRSALLACAGIFLLAALASQRASAQSGALRGNPIALEYDVDSIFQSAAIYHFLTSSWGQLYWIVGGAPLSGTLELDTGGGSSVNVGVLNQQVVASGGFVHLADMVNGPDGAIWLTGGYYNSAVD